ncbi:MAG: VWA domain-containing protein, partial [Pirellulaceae bacterium]|nr:VWA domain-containing protein [Pirellulaceae bacterium]
MSLSFRYPLLGLLLLIIPLSLIVWVWMRSGRSVVLPFDHGQQKSGVWFKGLINVAQSFPAVLLGVVVAILCGPQQLSEPRTKKRLTNIEFCVDISGSMTASFGDGTRYDASMEAINDFLDFRQGDAFALTFFGNSVMHWVPLTTDPSAIRYSPPYMRPENAPRGFGGT